MRFDWVACPAQCISIQPKKIEVRAAINCDRNRNVSYWWDWVQQELKGLVQGVGHMRKGCRRVFYVVALLWRRCFDI